MKKSFFVVFGMLICAALLQFGYAQEKASSSRTLKVKLHYTGAGTVDEKHLIRVFLFDSPDFVNGNAMPFNMQSGDSKDATVTFADTGKSPVYVAVVFDPSGGYDGQSGPPPSGSSLGVYTKAPPTPSPANIDEGKTVEVEVPFDDTAKMP